jgi:hypothetical protein
VNSGGEATRSDDELDDQEDDDEECETKAVLLLLLELWSGDDENSLPIVSGPCNAA